MVPVALNLPAFNCNVVFENETEVRVDLVTTNETTALLLNEEIVTASDAISIPIRDALIRISLATGYKIDVCVLKNNVI
jgi:hypothetical protein